MVILYDAVIDVSNMIWGGNLITKDIQQYMYINVKHH